MDASARVADALSAKPPSPRSHPGIADGGERRTTGHPRTGPTCGARGGGIHVAARELSIFEDHSDVTRARTLG